MQSAFKFIVKNGGMGTDTGLGNDFMLNLYDPNENVDWKDVV